MSDYERDNITVNGTDYRLYLGNVSSPWEPNLSPSTTDFDVAYPSVTSILNVRPDPEKDENIQGWKDWFDGSEPRRRPHWEDQFQYKGWRGTLAHYTVFKPLAEKDLFGDGEQEAERGISTWGDYDGEDMETRCLRDVNYVYNCFYDELAPSVHIEKDTVIEAEKPILNHDIGYAGTLDLLYEHPEDGTVVADLKTTSGIRDSYRFQLAAYSTACDVEVDTCKILWINPDDKEWRVEDESEWDRSRESYFREFAGIAERVNATTLTQDVLDEYLDDDE